jgi:predicted  nucleic acid-binding Zn-ribbon protein
MAICPKCGKNIGDDLYCKSCGTNRFARPERSKEGSDPQHRPFKTDSWTEKPENNSDPHYRPFKTEGWTEKPKSGNNAAVVVVFLVMMLLVVGILGYNITNEEGSAYVSVSVYATDPTEIVNVELSIDGDFRYSIELYPHSSYGHGEIITFSAKDGSKEITVMVLSTMNGTTSTYTKTLTLEDNGHYYADFYV